MSKVFVEEENNACSLFFEEIDKGEGKIFFNFFDNRGHACFKKSPDYSPEDKIWWIVENAPWEQLFEYEGSTYCPVFSYCVENNYYKLLDLILQKEEITEEYINSIEFNFSSDKKKERGESLLTYCLKNALFSSFCFLVDKGFCHYTEHPLESWGRKWRRGLMRPGLYENLIKRIIVNDSVDINCLVNEKTKFSDGLLWFLYQRNRIDLFEFLFKERKDVDISLKRDIKSHNILYHCCKKGDYDLLLLILDYIKDKSFDLSSCKRMKNYKGKFILVDPLGMAYRNNRIKIVEALLSYEGPSKLFDISRMDNFDYINKKIDILIDEYKESLNNNNN